MNIKELVPNPSYWVSLLVISTCQCTPASIYGHMAFNLGFPHSSFPGDGIKLPTVADRGSIGLQVLASLGAQVPVLLPISRAMACSIIVSPPMAAAYTGRSYTAICAKSGRYRNALQSHNNNAEQATDHFIMPRNYDGSSALLS